MKKIRLFTLLTLIVTFAILFMVGCEKTDNVSSVTLKDHDPNTVIDISSGNLDYSAYTVVVLYESGRIEELALTEQMIDDADLFKLYKIGEQDITISYGGKQYSFKVFVGRSSFEALAFPENNVFTYDGNAHVIELIGNIPANATVTYPGGNSFTNAGTYDVTAIIACDGYATTKLTTTVTIEKAKYDMSGIEFEAKEFVYDGKAHFVEISGTLPAGVSKPVYTINGKTASSVVDVGEYIVKASFTSANPNYEILSDMETTLKIIPATYDMTNIDLVFKREDGSVISSPWKVYDGKTVSFEISDTTLTERDMTVSYTAVDEDGNEVSSLVNAGVYTVTMQITLNNEKNYEEIAPITHTFRIKKAQYDISKIYFDSSLVKYDGTAYKLLVSLPEDHDIKPEDIIYEYRLGDELLDVDSNVGVTNAGVYTVTAIFPNNNPNYEQIVGIKPATLKIVQQTVDITDLGFVGIHAIEYDGADHAPDFISWKQINDTEYDVLTYSDRQYYKLNELGEYEPINEIPNDTGVYKCIVSARIADAYVGNYAFENSNAKVDFTISFEIYKKEFELPRVAVVDNVSFVYTGQKQFPTLDITSISDDVMTVVKSYCVYNAEDYTLIDEEPTNSGNYRVVILVSIDDEYRNNYSFIGGEYEAEYEIDFEICKQEIDLSRVKFENYENLIFNNSPQAPKFNYSEYETLVTNEQIRYFQENESGEYVQIASKPSRPGSYRMAVTLRVIDDSNFVLSDGESTADFVCNYEIGVPPSIDVTEIVEACQEPMVFHATGEDILPEIKAAVEAKIAEIWPDYRDKINNFWYINKSQSSVSKITEAGEYAVLMNSSEMMFDGTSYSKSIVIIHIVVS